MLKTSEQKVLKLIDECHLIEKDDKILIALSGGADSVFLYHFLIKYKKRLGINLGAFHLNHNIRGREAKEDERFCRDLCRENNVKLYVVSRDVRRFAKNNKISTEEAGRTLRYTELERISADESFDKIATAHNASDNAETVLLNLIKGAGLKGLSGIPVVRGNIIRPLLSLASNEIREYLRLKKVIYRLDSSNLESDYERNYIRNEIIPALISLNPKAEQKILSSSRIIRDLKAFFDKQVAAVTESCVEYSNEDLIINLRRLRKYDRTIRSEFFKNIIETQFKIELSAENINSLIKLAEYQSGKKITLSNKIIALKEREVISVRLKKPSLKKSLKKSIGINEKIEVNGSTLRIERILSGKIKRSGKKSVEYISADRIKPEFQLRYWQEGDRFYPLGMKGSKKISDFLIDEKISDIKKKQQLVLLNDDKIVWVVGLRIDDRFKLIPETEEIIKLSFE